VVNPQLNGNVISLSWDCFDSDRFGLNSITDIETNQEMHLLEYKIEQGDCARNDNSSRARFNGNRTRLMEHTCCDLKDWNKDTERNRDEEKGTIESINTANISQACTAKDSRIQVKIDLIRPAWCTQMLQIRIRKELHAGNTIGVSDYTTDFGWTDAKSCGDTQYLARPVFQNPHTWKCESCLIGSSCQGSVLYQEVRAFFGWYRLVNEANENTDQHQEGTDRFMECRHRPACLGATNERLKKQFVKTFNNNEDPALLDQMESCDADLGFQTYCNTTGNNGTVLKTDICRLCATCLPEYRRTNNGYGYRCDRCPQKR
jgi:hypothetical protein